MPVHCITFDKNGKEVDREIVSDNSLKTILEGFRNYCWDEMIDWDEYSSKLYINHIDKWIDEYRSKFEEE